MRSSKLVKNIFNHLLLLAMIIVAVIGVFIAKDLRQTSFDSQVKISTQLSMEQIDPPWLAAIGGPDSCVSGYIYTSWPAKCRTVDGEFI